MASRNPADIASRGISLTEKEVDIWFRGPLFLRTPKQITLQPSIFSDTPDGVEMKRVVQTIVSPDVSMNHRLIFQTFVVDGLVEEA